MKIKTKKEMNLPELIEWIFRNNIKNESYKTNGAEVYELYFDAYGTPRFSSLVYKHHTFTVEVEEEITENTVLPKLVTRNTSGRYNRWIDECVKGFHLELIEAIYILNDDLTMTLIWTREKGLVG